MQKRQVYMFYFTLYIAQVSSSPFMKILFSSAYFCPYSVPCSGFYEVNKDDYDLIPDVREYINQWGKMPQFGGDDKVLSKREDGYHQGHLEIIQGRSDIWPGR